MELLFDANRNDDLVLDAEIVAGRWSGSRYLVSRVWVNSTNMYTCKSMIELSFVSQVWVHDL
jgi:hypothetical protein